MAKVFYTETDIQDMVARGVLSLEVNDNVVLTDLAYEKAQRLGLKLVRDEPQAPPAAPVRPYILQPSLLGQPAPAAPQPASASPDLAQRIRSAVQARMGSQIDPALLDTIIQRVLTSTGVK